MEFTTPRVNPDVNYGFVVPGEISITSDMQMIPPLWQKVKRSEKAS